MGDSNNTPGAACPARDGAPPGIDVDNGEQLRVVAHDPGRVRPEVCRTALHVRFELLAGDASRCINENFTQLNVWDLRFHQEDLDLGRYGADLRRRIGIPHGLNPHGCAGSRETGTAEKDENAASVQFSKKSASGAARQQAGAEAHSHCRLLSRPSKAPNSLAPLMPWSLRLLLNSTWMCCACCASRRTGWMNSRSSCSWYS